MSQVVIERFFFFGGGGGRIRKAVSGVSERHLLFSPSSFNTLLLNASYMPGFVQNTFESPLKVYKMLSHQLLFFSS